MWPFAAETRAVFYVLQTTCCQFSIHGCAENSILFTSSVVLKFWLKVWQGWRAFGHVRLAEIYVMKVRMWHKFTVNCLIMMRNPGLLHFFVLMLVIDSRHSKTMYLKASCLPHNRSTMSKIRSKRPQVGRLNDLQVALANQDGADLRQPSFSVQLFSTFVIISHNTVRK